MLLWHSTLLHLTVTQHATVEEYILYLTMAQHFPACYYGTAHSCTLPWHSMFLHVTLAKHTPAPHCGTACSRMSLWHSTFCTLLWHSTFCTLLWHSMFLHVTLAQHIFVAYCGTAYSWTLLWHSMFLHVTRAQLIPAPYCGTAYSSTLLWHSMFQYLTVAQHVSNLFFVLSLLIQWQLLAKQVDTEIGTIFSRIRSVGTGQYESKYEVREQDSTNQNTKCGNRTVRINISFTRVPSVNPPSTKFNQNAFICSGDQTCRINDQTHFCSIRLCFAVCAKATHTDEETATYCKNYHDLT